MVRLESGYTTAWQTASSTHTASSLKVSRLVYVELYAISGLSLSALVAKVPILDTSYRDSTAIKLNAAPPIGADPTGKVPLVRTDPTTGGGSSQSPNAAVEIPHLGASSAHTARHTIGLVQLVQHIFTSPALDRMTSDSITVSRMHNASDRSLGNAAPVG